jgi:DNA-binding NarL/FixJ family response regulator
MDEVDRAHQLRQRKGRLVSRQTSVLVVDDDAMVRRWLQLSLEGSEFRLVGEAQDLAQGLELVERRRPQIVLVDQRLSGQFGIDLIRQLRDQDTDVQLVLMTSSPERGLNETAREAGAQGSLLKTGQPAELLKTLRAVAAGGDAFDPRHPPRANGIAPLTPRERAVLRLIAGGATNREVAAQLGIGEETVKTMLSRAFVKLGVRRRAEAVSVAHARGLL